MTRTVRGRPARRAAAWGAGLALTAAAAAGAATPVPPYVVIGEDGARIARVATRAAACPAIRVDGRRLVMTVRSAAAADPPRRDGGGESASHPAVFDETVCEARLPAAARSARIDGRRLPLPPARIRRIVVIGDTGCRLSDKSRVYQACDDPAAYPFARIAASAARWRPDLVIHVGDYVYRESPCPGPCSGSPWGYGADTWRADFLVPAAPLLRASAIVATRGNHETCDRAGQGWRRYLDPSPLDPATICDNPAEDASGDFSEPFAVPLGAGAQLIVVDSAKTPTLAPPAGDARIARFRAEYDVISRLAARAPHTLLVDHHPILGFAARRRADGSVELLPGNGGLQAAFGAASPRFAPPSVDMILSGHIHLWEAVGFSSDHPVQLVSGMSGTLEDTVPLPDRPPADMPPAPGAVVNAFSSWIDGFGYMTLERTGPARWRLAVRDVEGRVMRRCAVEGARLLWCAPGPAASSAPAR